MPLRAVIVDGYTDEPAGLGVPPYLDVYARYVAGALYDARKDCQVLYFTIDEVRSQLNQFLNLAQESKLLIFIAGVTVPGKYLGGRPATLADIVQIGEALEGPTKVLCGPVAKFGFAERGGTVAKPLQRGVKDLYDVVVEGDPEEVIHDLALFNFQSSKIDPKAARRDYAKVDRFAVKGAKIVLDHPNYGRNLICELETFRGCPRWFTGGCSFCTEPLYGPPCFRDAEGLLEEVKALSQLGVANFRVGRQPDILAYKAKRVGDVEFPAPNPDEIERLFHGVRSCAGDVRVLHIDNVNPGTVAHNPEESREALKAIIEYHTPGDVAAMGIESVDPNVVKMNNLKVSYDEALLAVELVNSVGSLRGRNGLPHLLPGVNFVYGLAGESAETFRENLRFMKDVLNRGLMVRRINIRQVMVFQGTGMSHAGAKYVRRHRRLFKKYKDLMRREVDLPMLRRVVPKLTVLREVYAEVFEGNMTWARQVGSYPILCAIPAKVELDKYYDLVVVDHGYRSVTAVPAPLNVNRADIRLLTSLPGVGEKRAARIIMGRPYRSKDELAEVLRSLNVPDLGPLLDVLSVQ